MIAKMLPLCLVFSTSLAAAAPPIYDLWLQEDIEHSYFYQAGGNLGSLEVFDRGLCGGFVVQTFGNRVEGDAYNVNFSGYTPSGFRGAGRQYDVSPVFVLSPVLGVGYGQGLSYVTANFEALGDRFRYDYSNYAIVNGTRINFGSGLTAGKIVFVTIPPTVPAIPEPESFALMLAGLPAIILARR